MIEKLLKKELYQDEFKKLRSKVHAGKFSLSSYAVNKAITLRWILYNEDFVINELIKTIKNNKYENPLSIEKKVLIDKKERILYSFDWHEIILQGAISSLLFKVLEPQLSDSLNSYRKGRGTHNTLITLSDYISSLIESGPVYILKRDIKAYGDSIPHDVLSQTLKKFVPEEDFVNLIKKIINFNYIEHKTGILKKKDLGLPTGSPINNLIINMFLTDMDKKIDNYKNESCYFRYGDDILVATPKKSTADKITRILNNNITKKGLHFNKDKVVDIKFDITTNKNESFKYLGLMVKSNGGLALSKEKELDIRTQIKKTVSKIDKLSSKVTREEKDKIQSIISSLKVLFYKTDFLAELASYFPIISDDNYWKDLDLWTARTVLSKIYKKQGDRVFKKYPFKDLRKNGLPSIRHSRRLYLDDRNRFYKYINIKE